MVIKIVLTMSMMMMTMSIQGTLLKPNMVTSGTKCKSQADPQEVDMDKCIWTNVYVDKCETKCKTNTRDRYGRIDVDG